MKATVKININKKDNMANILLNVDIALDEEQIIEAMVLNYGWTEKEKSEKNLADYSNKEIKDSIEWYVFEKYDLHKIFPIGMLRNFIEIERV